MVSEDLKQGSGAGAGAGARLWGRSAVAKS